MKSNNQIINLSLKKEKLKAAKEAMDRKSNFYRSKNLQSYPNIIK